MKREFAATGVALVLVGLFSAPGYAAGWMTGAEIEQLVSGNTTYGKHETKGFTSYSYNRPDGTAVGRNTRDGDTTGTWRVKDDMICRQREGDPKENCQKVKDNGDGTYNRYQASKNVMRGDIHVFTWTKVVPGNPENL
ncbi:MAG: hypothetical protein KDJ39_15265 [Gammaproteobacteria bacterium]|nr:hypothetical protein [Gammaproteobacteria bacterium]